MLVEGVIGSIRKFIMAHGPLHGGHTIFEPRRNPSRFTLCQVTVVGKDRQWENLLLLGFPREKGQLEVYLNIPDWGVWAEKNKDLLKYKKGINRLVVEEFIDGFWLPYIEKELLPYEGKPNPERIQRELSEKYEVAVRGHSRRPHYRKLKDGTLVYVHGSKVSPHARRKVM